MGKWKNWLPEAVCFVDVVEEEIENVKDGGDDLVSKNKMLYPSQGTKETHSLRKEWLYKRTSVYCLKRK